MIDDHMRPEGPMPLLQVESENVRGVKRTHQVYLLAVQSSDPGEYTMAVKEVTPAQVVCPACGSREAVFVGGSRSGRKEMHVYQYRCSRCGTVFPVTAGFR